MPLREDPRILVLARQLAEVNSLLGRSHPGTVMRDLGAATETALRAILEACAAAKDGNFDREFRRARQEIAEGRKISADTFADWTLDEMKAVWNLAKVVKYWVHVAKEEAPAAVRDLPFERLIEWRNKSVHGHAVPDPKVLQKLLVDVELFFQAVWPETKVAFDRTYRRSRVPVALAAIAGCLVGSAGVLAVGTWLQGDLPERSSSACPNTVADAAMAGRDAEGVDATAEGGDGALDLDEESEAAGDAEIATGGEGHASEAVDLDGDGVEQGTAETEGADGGQGETNSEVVLDAAYSFGSEVDAPATGTSLSDASSALTGVASDGATTAAVTAAGSLPVVETCGRVVDFLRDRCGWLQAEKLREEFMQECTRVRVDLLARVLQEIPGSGWLAGAWTFFVDINPLTPSTCDLVRGGLAGLSAELESTLGVR